MHRVAVTGLGVVAPLGLNLPEFQRRLLAGECAIAPLTFSRGDQQATYRAAPILGFDPAAHFETKKLAILDRFSQFAVVAAREAAAMARFTPNPALAASTATIFGSGVGGQITMEEGYDRIWSNPTMGRMHPLTVPRLMANANSSQVSMELGLQGPAFTIASACASATHAIGTAFQMVRSGMVRAAVTGGSEACLTLGTLKGWEALRVMSPDFCRPFSLGRQGMILAEGGAALVLERYADAEARGAPILAEIVGFGQTADAKDITTPDQQGMVRAMQAALDDAGIAPTDIDHINAHGTGTRANDTTESAALRQLFGARMPSLTANKSQFGHALGAAGALETIASIISLLTGKIPPTINWTTPDPDCGVTPVQPEQALPPPRTILKNSFAFGGLNAVLALRAGQAL